DGPAYQRAVSWWQEKLSNMPPPFKLPGKRTRPEKQQNADEGQIRWGADPQASELLRELGRTEPPTFYFARLAVFITLVSTEAAQPDVVIGGHMTIRNRVALQDIFGPFHNLVTLRFRFEPHKTFREWLLIVRDQLLETETYGELPHEELRKE